MKASTTATAEQKLEIDVSGPGQCAVKARNLSKRYRVYQKHFLPVWGVISSVAWQATKNFSRSFGIGKLRKAVYALGGDDHDEFSALDDISFEVARGEAFGILGRNGAGKSTLLQILVGTLQPNEGTVEVTGRIGALLELGSGLNPDYTGRENIYLGASLLGLSREKTNSELNKVIEFAAIGEFIDQPTHTYSSGMQVRLAFAINACLEPDVLIIDEALAVGDAPFQAKCYRHLRSLQEAGATVLFTSHSVDTVRSLCTRAMWLDHGQIRMIGEAKDVAAAYERFCWQAQGTILEGHTEENIGETIESANMSIEGGAVEKSNSGEENANEHFEALIAGATGSIPVELFEPNQYLEELDADLRYGTGSLTIKNVLLTDDVNEARSSFDYAETAYLHYLINAQNKVDRGYQMGARLSDVRGNVVASFSDIRQKLDLVSQKGDLFYVKIALPIFVTEGAYTLAVSLIGADRNLPERNYDFSQAEVYDCIDTAAVFEIRPCVHGGLAGPVHFDTPIDIRLISDAERRRLENEVG